jgi:hypothetical protein
MSLDVLRISIGSIGIKIYNNNKIRHCLNFPLIYCNFIAGRLLIKLYNWCLEIGKPV